MEKIKDIIEQILENDSQWTEYKSLEDIENEETQQLINNLVAQVRCFIKQNDREELEQIKNIIINQEMYQIIIEISEFTLRHYRAWKIVRMLEENNEELMQILLQNIMDKYVLRVEYDFQRTYATYEIKEQDEFMELLVSYDTMVSYYIQRHFGKKTIIQDIIEETDISSETAELFADLMERNYRELQINEILDGLQKRESRKD